MAELDTRLMEGPAWIAARRDAWFRGVGFVLRTRDGDIRVSPDIVTIGPDALIHTQPIELKMPGDLYYLLVRDGDDTRVIDCPGGKAPGPD